MHSSRMHTICSVAISEGSAGEEVYTLTYPHTPLSTLPFAHTSLPMPPRHPDGHPHPPLPWCMLGYTSLCGQTKMSNIIFSIN